MVAGPARELKAPQLYRPRRLANDARMSSHGKPIYLSFLNGPDIAELDMTNDEIIGAIEASLSAQGLGETVIEPRMHLKPDPKVHGHFNVLRGAIGPPI